MSSRDRIFEAIRTGLASSRCESQAFAVQAAELLAAPERIRPRLSAKPLSEIFVERILLPHMGATLDRIAHLGELPDAIRRYMSAHELPLSIALQPTNALTQLDWKGIEVHQILAPDEAVGVGLALWGIAETGSLVFHSGPDAPTLLNFLPLHHVVALEVRSILAYLEDHAEAEAKTEPPPRNVNIITGASGTTDIEGSYVRGAHGPRFLHVILFGANT